MAKTALTDDVVSKRAYHRSTSHIYCMHIWIELLADWYGHQFNVSQIRLLSICSPSARYIWRWCCCCCNVFSSSSLWQGFDAVLVLFVLNRIINIGSVLRLYDDHGKMSRYQRVSFFFTSCIPHVHICKRAYKMSVFLW